MQESNKPTRPSVTKPSPKPKTGAQREPVRKVEIQEQNIQVDDDFDDFNTGLVNDTVQENKDKGKKEKKKKEKKVLTPEQKKKQTKIMLFTALFTGVLLIALIAIKSIASLNNKHLVTKDETEQTEVMEETSIQSIETQEESEEQPSETEVVQEKENKSIQVSKEDTTQIAKGTVTTLKVGEYGYIDTLVNTKTADDKAFTDHESYILIGMTGLTSSYDNTSKLIESYNESNSENKVIKLPDKDSYYKQSNGTELVSYTITIAYPDDYPTSASEGYIYTLPEVKLNLRGTVEDIDNDDLEQSPEHYIVVDDNIYNISKITELKDMPERAEAGGELTYKFVTSIPAGANKTNYAIDIQVLLGDNEYNIVYEGVSIESSGYKLDAVKSVDDIETEESSIAIEE